MTRQEIVRRLVLNSISDDYENVDQVILRDVAQACSRFEFIVERPDVVNALAELVKDGLAKAYLLYGREPFKEELAGMPALDVVETYFKTYFYITKRGMDFHMSDDKWYPFDDDGNPRRGAL